MTTLVSDPEAQQAITLREETDERTALTRGLKEYLETLSIDFPGGRRTRFKAVTEGWAEPEQNAKYPSAAVYTTDSGQYGTGSTKLVPAKFDAPDIGSYDSPYEFVQVINLEIWTTDPQERMAAVLLVEYALNPVDWSYGLRLSLPHYHGVHAVYSMQSMSYADSDTDAMRRYRRATFAIEARLPSIRVRKPARVQIHPRIDLTATEGVLPPGESFGSVVPVRAGSGG